LLEIARGSAIDDNRGRFCLYKATFSITAAGIDHVFTDNAFSFAGNTSAWTT